MNMNVSEYGEIDDVQAYVACLGCYNNGDLVGDWLGYAELQALSGPSGAGCASPEEHEEMMVHDWIGLPSVMADECTVSEAVERIEWYAEVVAVVGDREAVDAFIESEGDSYPPSEIEKSYVGPYESAEDYLRELWEDQGIRGDILSYVDWDAMARDYEADGYLFLDTPAGVAIFAA